MILKTFGSGRPVIAIVTCMHGDEQCGLAAIETVEKMQLRGTAKCIIANPSAVSANKRFLIKDPNKCFPGKTDGCEEEKLAFDVYNEIHDCDYVVDLHSCTSTEEPFVIMTQRNEANYCLSHYSGLQKLVLMSGHLKQNKALIDYHSAAISIECGLKNSSAADQNAKEIVTNILRNLGIVEGSAIKGAPEKFEVFDIIQLPEPSFIPADISNFKLVKAGQILGSAQTTAITAQDEFYPVLFNEESYVKEGILGLVARKIT